MDYLLFKKHCVLSFLLRIVLVMYADFHDSLFNVSYTDVDYKVFTDAARHMIEGGSPFDRHTYRYTPLLALLVTPNVFLYKNFGKILFSLTDIVIAILIRKILLRQKHKDSIINTSVLLWLYNPLTVVISTRGNADSIAVLLVIITLDFLQTDKVFLAGISHGFSIHFRLYPIVFSGTMLLSLSKQNLLMLNKNQLKFICSCCFTFLSLTFVSYYFYGYKYLYESLFYHLLRKDTKHNFSVYFYMFYLSINDEINIIEKVLTVSPQLLLLFLLSYWYSDKCNLPFALFTQAMVLVTYNSVMTSQYFFWFLSILPLCLPDIEIGIFRLLSLISAWIFSQAAWLCAAYLLEFQGLNTFYFIWISGLLFFITNVNILRNLIQSYKYY